MARDWGGRCFFFFVVKVSRRQRDLITQLSSFFFFFFLNPLSSVAHCSLINIVLVECVFGLFKVLYFLLSIGKLPVCWIHWIHCLVFGIRYWEGGRGKGEVS